jgi:prepilin-type N-terminal cleavage/methylation domain-containing protein
MKHRGFTLLEMMIVIAIIGIMTALASGSFIEARRLGESREEARSLFNYLRNARSLSVSTQTPHGLYLGVAATDANMNNRVAVVRQTADGGTKMVLDHMLSGTPPGNSIAIRVLDPTGAAPTGIENNVGTEVRIGFDTDGIPRRFPSGNPLNETFLIFAVRNTRFDNPGLATPAAKAKANYSSRCVKMFRTGDILIYWNDPAAPVGGLEECQF